MSDASGGSGSGAFERLGEDVIYESWITLAKAQLRAPDGTVFSREVVHHPGAVSVVPLLDDGDTVILVRQYRAAVDAQLCEIPAGKRDVEGEEPLVTAHRELAEETGMRAGRMDLLCGVYNAPGFCDEHQFIYLARDLEEVETSSQSIEEQHMTIERVSLRAFPELLANGVVRDAKTMLGLLLARDHVAAGR